MKTNGRLLMLLTLLLFSTGNAFAQDSCTLLKDDSAICSITDKTPAIYVYQRPKKWGFITNVPDDLWEIAKSPFKKENLPGLMVVAGSTALLIWHDQAIVNGSRQLARNIHLHDETDYKTIIKSGNTRILKIPNNINSALYQMGEGGTSLLIAGGLFLYGKFNQDYRALQTASDLVETFISMGVATQLLKRVFGRESPFVATGPGGNWHPFPSFSEYQRNTPQCDAFPSGHLATVMATITVLAGNYPEKKWIKPVGYTIMGLIGFAMMNTEVHWAGDYPLAIALGYIAGKVTVHRHRKNRDGTGM